MLHEKNISKSTWTGPQSAFLKRGQVDESTLCTFCLHPYGRRSLASEQNPEVTDLSSKLERLRVLAKYLRASAFPAKKETV